MKLLLSGVDEHLQDQILNVITAGASNRFHTGEPSYNAYVTASDVFGNMTYSVASSVLSSLSQYAAAVLAASKYTLNASDLEFSFQIQTEYSHRPLPVPSLVYVGTSSLSLEAISTSILPTQPPLPPLI